MPSYFGPHGELLHFDDIGAGNGEAERVITVLLAGGPARHPSYLGDGAGLGEERRLIVAHLRGVGRTPAPEQPERGSFWSQAEDIEHLREHLDADRLVVVGHSAGTRVALSFAARFPDRVEKLVLITPPAAYLVEEPSDTETIRRRRQGDVIFESAFATLMAGPAGDDDDSFNAWQRDSAPVGYARWGAREEAHTQVGRWNRPAAEAFFSVAPPDDLAARLGQMRAPTLVIAGAEDSLTGAAQASALARLFPAGESVVIGESGHYPWLEQPVGFRQAIDEFLRRDPS